MSTVLKPEAREALRRALIGRLVVLCFGAGVDSTAMLVALRAAGVRPDAITFADTGGERPETLAHVVRINEVLRVWGWPEVVTVRKVPMASTGYEDLYGNCVANETLPSLAFGMKSCSIKWKQVPQDQYLQGVTRGPTTRPPHPLWMRAQAEGQRVVKLIGYDCGKADLRRSRAIKTTGDAFDYVYPLQLVGWRRTDCVGAIAAELGAELVPVKSACFFCPASKAWELWWLAAHHPELLERALHLERVALTGRHSRFDAVEFGASWDDLVRDADRFPSTTTTVGLGRSFSWNQWARVNGVVDETFEVLRTAQARARFDACAVALCEDDNALDARSTLARPVRLVRRQAELAW